MIKILISILIVSILTGCVPKTFGVGRLAYLENIKPNFNCIKLSLEDIDGVSNVHYQIEEGGRPITWHGLEAPNKVHRFEYSFKGIYNANLFFITDYENNTDYHHSMSAVDYEKGQELTTSFYPFMKNLELLIEKRCGLPNFREDIIPFCDYDLCN